MSLVVRDARPGDAGLILGFVRELADYEKLTDEMQADEAMFADALFGDAPRVFCDIGEWDGQAVGFSLWFYSFSTFVGRHGIYLEDLYVQPAFRGKGVGKALLAGLARRCVTEKLGRLEWSVLDWNEPSIAFYESVGAEPLDDWTMYRVTGTAIDDLAEAAP